MSRSTIGRVVAAVAVILALALPLPATAQAADPFPRDGTVVIQANVDLTVPEGTRRDAVILFSADATIQGQVRTLVVFDGTATLSGARVETLVVAGGMVDVGAGSTVDEVRTIDTTSHVAPGAVVGSQLSVDPALLAAGLAPVAIVIWIGLVLAYVLAGLVVAAIAGDQLRRAGAAITSRPGPVALGAIGALVGLPLVIAALAVTIVGIPTALLVAIVVLPMVWFVGSIVVAVRVGDWILLRSRGRVEAHHPLVAALIGSIVVVLLSVIPFVGFVIGLAGAGAVVVLAWTAAFGDDSPARPATTLEVGPAPA